MSPQNYLDRYQGQSLLYNTRDPSLRGQCVQSVCFFVVANGKPVMWLDAAEWWYSGQYPEHYDRIPNTSSAVPLPGDIIIWGRDLPNSGRAGHIAVCLRSMPGTGTFISVDQNWGGKTVHAVTHNYNYVVGWLRFKGAQPAPSPTPQSQGGDEMIVNADQATKVYKMLRPNGGASQGEINATAGRRSFAAFINDAQAEINVRDANFRAQGAQLAEMSQTINVQNLTITELNAKLNDATLSGAQKQKALDDALAKIASQNSQIASTHDEIVDLQNKVVVTKEPQPEPNGFIKFLRLFVKKKS